MWLMVNQARNQSTKGWLYNKNLNIFLLAKTDNIWVTIFSANSSILVFTGSNIFMALLTFICLLEQLFKKYLNDRFNEKYIKKEKIER